MVITNQIADEAAQVNMKITTISYNYEKRILYSCICLYVGGLRYAETGC